LSLENRTAAITGATGGLGSVLARDLAAQGVNLALLDRNLEKLRALASSLALPESRLLVHKANLLDPGEVQSAADLIIARLGRLDILLHVVGGWTGGKTLFDSPPADLDFMLNQHVWTSFHAVRAFVPHLVQNGWGRVVMVTSPLAARPNAKGGPYAIAKAAQEALMLTLSQELKDSGVTANLLQVKSIDVKREKISAPAPANASWTTPEELSAAVLYLLSEEAGAVNGARFPMYGSFG